MTDNRGPEGLNPDELHKLSGPQLFRAAFGAQAQRQRLAEREKAERERQALEDLNRRRAYLDGLREPRG